MMTKANTIARKPAAPAKASPISKLGATRKAAFMAIAPNAFSEAQSRATSIANLKVALGNGPNADTIAAARIEWIIGRATFRMPPVEFGRTASADTMAKLLFVRDRVENYAAPVKEGAKAKKLRAGQTGRRTAMQHRIIRNAEEAWSQVLAELGLNAAKTQSERNAAKKTAAPSMAGSGKGKAKAATPSHASLVAAPKPLNRAEACQYVVTQAATLLAFANKNAKLLPTDFGTAINAFKAAINKAANEQAVRDAAADAVKADKFK